MALFPPYEPNERSYDLGVHPMVTQEGWAGGAVRFRTGGARTGVVLTLVFRRLIEAAAKDIRDHYRGQLSGTVPFQLGSITYTSAKQWVYDDRPQEVQSSGGLIDVVVRLRSVR